MARTAASTAAPATQPQIFHAPRLGGVGWPGRTAPGALHADWSPCLRARFRRFLELITTFLFYHSARLKASLTKKISSALPRAIWPAEKAWRFCLLLQN